MRVERTSIALGLVLAVAGAMVALNGYVYVNVDRGPPLMISGTLLLGMGLVLAALGFILRELQKISADASKAALLLAKGRNGTPEPAASAPPAPAPAQPKPLAPLAPFEPPPAPSSAAMAPEAPPAHSETPADMFPPPSDEKPRRRVLPPATALAPFPEEQVKPALPPLSWMIKPGQTEAEKSGPAKPEEDDWLNQAIAAEADKAARQEPARKTFLQKEAREPAAEEATADPYAIKPLKPPKSRDLAQDQPDVREEAAAPPKPAPEAAANAETPKPEVIGHYEAHGAHYTMYADGSIEAETQHGVYRFGSIEELKRFIEGGEDSAL